MAPTLVYLQRRSQKAGAQTCLARLVRNPCLARFNPTVICGEYGWLTTELKRSGVRFFVQPFPSSRSLLARLWANERFATRLAQQLRPLGQYFLVHGNDHQEGILTISLAHKLGASTAIFLRSPHMTIKDYKKYKCAKIKAVITVSHELMDRLAVWDPNKMFRVVSDGIYPEEIAGSFKQSVDRPRRFIVLGSPLKWKGWRDLVDALHLLRVRGFALDGLSFDFTGVEPGSQNDLDLGRLAGIPIRFLGRRDDFPALLAGYDFAINPSHHETFGMAAVETIAMGVPLLSSRTGVMPDLVDPHLLYSPGDVHGLSDKLGLVINSPTPSSESLKALQRNLLFRYNITNSAKTLAEIYDEQ